MPGRDGTGPNGMGRGTGRGVGFCAETDDPGPSSPGPRFGERLRRRMGGGRRAGFGGSRWMGRVVRDDAESPPDAEQEKQLLRDRSKALKLEIEQIDRRLSQLGSVNHE